MSYAPHYQKHLDEVSRSFSFCIARLNSPLKEWVGLGYLLFRVLDTIEDADWQNQILKNETFKKFEEALNSEKNEIHDSIWMTKFPESIPRVEKNLLENLPQLLEDLYELPEAVQTSFKSSLIMMSQGMQYFSNLEFKSRQIELKTLKEVNQYCFFVAGLVGEFLTNLILPKLPPAAVNSELYLNSFQFGIFLQKINLLKDQAQDESEGRFLVPDRKELLQSLRENAAGALNYILHLPLAEKEFRLFCSWSLFLGLTSLSTIENSFLVKMAGKLPRRMTEMLISKIESMIDNNQALIQFFNEKIKVLPIENEIISDQKSVQSSWLTNIYHGTLQASDLQKLGVI